MTKRREERTEMDMRAELAAINGFAKTALTEEQVYAFSMKLCDNEVDRDGERFDATALGKLAGLFVGKTGIFNHDWNAHGQCARIYRAEVEKTGRNNSLGEPELVLRGDAYILRTDEMQPIIEKIEGGILKEVSVGFAVEGCKCSVCGAPMGTEGTCEKGHEKGQSYDGALCYGLLCNPVDAYEFSFVAVPAQRRAGVRKAYMQARENALEQVLEMDLSKYPQQTEKLLKHCQEALQGQEERRQRQQMLAENIKFLEGERK
ncbi:MAG: hypothetical protein KH334_02875 [Clostridiales bacterium]|nr:hypothetical protein [Clostridiales bacterium]